MCSYNKFPECDGGQEHRWLGPTLETPNSAVCGVCLTSITIGKGLTVDWKRVVDENAGNISITC